MINRKTDIITVKEPNKPASSTLAKRLHNHTEKPNKNPINITWKILSIKASFPAHKSGVQEYIFVESGKLCVELGNGIFKDELNEGDSFFFEADTEHRFINIGDEECRYFLVIDSIQVKK